MMLKTISGGNIMKKNVLKMSEEFAEIICLFRMCMFIQTGTSVFEINLLKNISLVCQI